MSDMLDIQRQIRDLAARLEQLEKADISRHVGARVYRSTVQSISNNTVTPISFDTERWDTDAFWVVGSPTRLTIPGAGYYLVGGGVEFASGASNRRETFLRLNGATRLADFEIAVNVGTTEAARHFIATYYSFAADDYMELCVFQSSGGALNVNTSANYSPEFWIVKVG